MAFPNQGYPARSYQSDHTPERSFSRASNCSIYSDGSATCVPDSRTPFEKRNYEQHNYGQSLRNPYHSPPPPPPPPVNYGTPYDGRYDSINNAPPTRDAKSRGGACGPIWAKWLWGVGAIVIVAVIAIVLVKLLKPNALSTTQSISNAYTSIGMAEPVTVTASVPIVTSTVSVMTVATTTATDSLMSIATVTRVDFAVVTVDNGRDG